MILLSYNISMDNENKIKFLEEENSKLKLELEKYKNSHKSYYEKNKKNIMEKANERLQKIAKENPDKKKEYARNAYLKQKEKKKKNMENINI
jgi:hypothetical protein